MIVPKYFKRKSYYKTAIADIYLHHCFIAIGEFHTSKNVSLIYDLIAPKHVLTIEINLLIALRLWTMDAKLRTKDQVMR